MPGQKRSHGGVGPMTKRRRYTRYRYPRRPGQWGARRPFSTRGARTAYFNVRRTVEFGNIVASGAADTFFSWKFLLSDLPTPADFTALFDQYRFEKVVLKFYPGTIETNSADAPLLITVIDYDDATIPAAASTLLQYDNCKQSMYPNPHFVTLRPRMAMAAFGGGLFSSYANVAPQWVDAASNTVEHYGIKGCLKQSSSNIVYRVYADYYLTFKSAR